MAAPLLYDEDTGSVDNSVLETAQQDSEAHEYELAAQVERMSATDGWRQLEAWLADAIGACKEKLIDVDPSRLHELVQLQQTARAYSNVIGFVHERSAHANAFREQQSSSAAPKSNDPAA